MFEFLKNLFKIDKNEIKTFNKISQVNPYIPKGMRALFIADTHSMIKEEEIELMESGDYDMVIILGDSSSNLPIICSSIPENIPVYGILGNHDGWHCYENTRINYIGGKVTDLYDKYGNSIKVSAIDGSVKYKNSPDRCMYTQKEYYDILENMEKADICISHTLPSENEDEPDFGDMENGYSLVDAHTGVNALRDYIEKYEIPLHFYGHIHDRNVKTLRNGTISRCIYKFEIVEI